MYSKECVETFLKQQGQLSDRGRMTTLQKAILEILQLFSHYYKWNE